MAAEKLALLFTIRQTVRNAYFHLSQHRDGLFDDLTGCVLLLSTSLQILDKTLDNETVKASEELVKACADSQQGINDAVRLLRAKGSTKA